MDIIANFPCRIVRTMDDLNLVSAESSSTSPYSSSTCAIRIAFLRPVLSLSRCPQSPAVVAPVFYSILPSKNPIQMRIR